MMKKSKLNKMTLLTTIVGGILVITGVTYALFNANLLGIREQAIKIGQNVLFEYDESVDGLTVTNADIKSDEEGKITDNYFDFQVSLTSSNSGTLNYSIYITKEDDSTVPEDKIKLYLTDQNDVLIRNVIKIKDLEKHITYKNSYYLYGTSITSNNKTKISHDYRLRMFIDESYTPESEDVSSGSSHGIQMIRQTYKFKINVVTERYPSQLDTSGANAPELATNMIPVYYDGETWRKADSKNRYEQYQWYNYDEKMWANAVTVKSASREKYLNASLGTKISIDDINAMFVWIPRFVVASTNRCSTLTNPTQDANPECFELDYSLITQEVKEGAVNFAYVMYLLNEVRSSRDELMFEFDEKIENKDEEYIYQALSIYLMGSDVGGYTTLSEADKNYFNGTEKEELANEMLEIEESGGALYLIYMIEKAGGSGTSTSEITVSSDEPYLKYMCEEFGFDDAGCDDFITNFNSMNNSNKIAMLLDLMTYPETETYYSNKVNEKFYKYDENNYAMGELEMHNGGTVNHPGAFNTIFVSNKYNAHDAFTFGTQNLSGFWMGKFEVSSDVTCVPASDSAVGSGCNLTTITPNIVPNVESWRGAYISTLFTVSRQMELSGNPYGFEQTSTTTSVNSDGSIASDSNNIDTHMSKNNEWGAVAYLSQSVYGRCTSFTSCSEIGINNSSNYITGMGAPANSRGVPELGSVYVKPQAYDTVQGMDASTTGNIYGIYDMSGGADENVMGNYNSTVSNYGIIPASKYINIYTTEEAYTSSGLQHALVETAGWYIDYYDFIDNDHPWVLRGGDYNGLQGGIFYVTNSNSLSIVMHTTRISLIVN